MSRWRRIVRNYFTFNQRERRGLYVLLLLLTVLCIIHAVIRLYPTKGFELTLEQKEKIRQFEQLQIDLKAQREKEFEDDFKEDDLADVEWTDFDPNELSAEGFAALGLDSSLSYRIVNYRSKGGKFYDTDDVARIYGMNEAWLAEAEDYMQFPQKTEPKKFEYKKFDDRKDTFERKKRPKIEVIELNAADSLQLVAIPWIGPFYAKEIVKLRNGLGGFRSYDQLLDVYRIKDESIESLIEYSTLDTALIEPININACDVQRLGMHPYLTWKQARVIVNYREQHGAYQSTEGILKTRVVNDSVYAKIAPYLSIE